MTEKLLMKDTEIERALTRIAHEILERNQGIDDLMLIGVRTRGVPLAKRLQQRIYAFEHLIVPIGSLDIQCNNPCLSPILTLPLTFPVRKWSW